MGGVKATFETPLPTAPPGTRPRPAGHSGQSRGGPGAQGHPGKAGAEAGAAAGLPPALPGSPPPWAHAERSEGAGGRKWRPGMIRGGFAARPV